MKTQPTFHEIDEQHAALMRACSLPTYQELCNLNEELLAALRDLLNTYAAMINVPVSQITSGVGGQARSAIKKAVDL